MSARVIIILIKINLIMTIIFQREILAQIFGDIIYKCFTEKNYYIIYHKRWGVIIFTMNICSH